MNLRARHASGPATVAAGKSWEVNTYHKPEGSTIESTSEVAPEADFSPGSPEIPVIRCWCQCTAISGPRPACKGSIIDKTTTQQLRDERLTDIVGRANMDLYRAFGGRGMPG